MHDTDIDGAAFNVPDTVNFTSDLQKFSLQTSKVDDLLVDDDIKVSSPVINIYYPPDEISKLLAVNRTVT